MSPAIPKPSCAGTGDCISKRPAAASPTFQPVNMVCVPANHGILEPPHRVCSFFKRASWQPYHVVIVKGNWYGGIVRLHFSLLGVCIRVLWRVAWRWQPLFSRQDCGNRETRNGYLRSIIEATNVYSYLLRRSTNSSWPQAERRGRFPLVPAS